jgi:hypothetical protein
MSTHKCTRWIFLHDVAFFPDTKALALALRQSVIEEARRRASAGGWGVSET